MSSLQSHLDPRILCIHLPVLAEQLFRLFRNHLRQDDLDFYKLIAVRVRVAQ